MYYANVASKSFSDNFQVGKNTSRQKYILGTFQRVRICAEKVEQLKHQMEKEGTSTTAVADLE